MRPADTYIIRDPDGDVEVATAADLESAALAYRTIIAEGHRGLKVYRRDPDGFRPGAYTYADVTIKAHRVAVRQITEMEVA